MSHKASVLCFYRSWSFWNFLCRLAVFTICLDPTAVLGCSECRETLTSPSGQFTSPCFPNEYVSNLNCHWTIRAPPGFIIQLTFHEFELEEAQGCPYDVVSISTGAEHIKFCGVTAKGHTLNSTGSEMIVTFKTDFSIQKRGFSATYTQVAVSLRNQKVVLTKTSQSQAISVSPSVAIPELRQFTVCMEVKSSTVTKRWTLFSYLDSSDMTLINFRKDRNKIRLAVSDVVCDVGKIWEENFSDEMIADAWRQLCLSWDGTSGDVITQTQDKHELNPCTASRNKVIANRGTLTLAPEMIPASSTYTGELYNFRLWNFSMSGQTLLDLTCDEMGNIVDWENSFWDVPADVLEPDSDLSCATTLLTQTTIRPTDCSSPGSGCQATTSANLITSTTNTHGANSPEPFTSGTNVPFTEVTTQEPREPTEPSLQTSTRFQNSNGSSPNSEAGSFNDTDLQGFQVPVPAVLRANHSLLKVSWQRLTSQTEQRMRSSRNPLGIISTPLRYPLRPRPNMPSAFRPGILNTHSASIVFTKAITKRPHGTTEDSKALKRATSSAGNGSATKKKPNTSRLASDLITRLRKPINQSWDLKVSGENLTHNVTEDNDFDSGSEMSSITLESHEILTTEEGADAGLGALYSLVQSIPSALSPSQHVIDDRSTGWLKTVVIPSQMPSLVLYPTIRPTPTVPVHKVNTQTTVVFHGYLLYGSLWMATSSSNQMGNPLNTLHAPLRNQFNTETTASSLHDNIESSIDAHELTFHMYHFDIRSSSTALPMDNINSLSSWPPSLLAPGHVGSDDPKSIISSTTFEKDNSSFTVTQLTNATDLVHLTSNFAKESISSTQRLFISTEKLEYQLRQSEKFTLFPGQFSVRGQEDGIPILVQSTDMDSLVMSTKSHKNLNHPDAVIHVSSAPSMPDVGNSPSTPDNFWGNSLKPSTSEHNKSVRHFQYNTETLSMGDLEFSIHPSISGTVQSGNTNAIVLQTGAQTHIEMSSTSVVTRVFESPLAQIRHLSPLKVASPSIDSQWRLSAGEPHPHFLPVSQKLTDKDHNQVSLTNIILHITQSHQRAPLVTESKWKTLALDDTGLLTKAEEVSLLPLYTSTDLTPETLHLKNESSALADKLKPSLETSIVKVGRTWTVPLDWIPEVTDMLQPVSLDVSAIVRSENATSLHHDDLSELEKILALTPNSTHGYMNGTDFPSFPLTVPERFQNHWGIISHVIKSSTVTSGSQTQDKRVTSTTQQEKKVQLEHQLAKVSADDTKTWHSLLVSVPDRTKSFVAHAFGSPALRWEPFSNSVLERSKDLQAVTMMPVHLGAQWALLSTHTQLLTRSPQLMNSDGIFTGTEPKHMPDRSSAQPSKDFSTIAINITLTSQTLARTLQHLEPQQFSEEPNFYNQGLHSFPLSISAHGLSVRFTSTSVGAPQLNVGTEELILVPTLPMNSTPALSIIVPPNQSIWGIVISTGTNTLPEQPLQPSQTSTTCLSQLESIFSSATVTLPPFPSHDAYGLNVAPSMSLESAPGQASASCLCEEADWTGCLCGAMVANWGLLYRTQFTVHDLTNGNMSKVQLEQRVSVWLTESFQNWNYSVYVESVRILESNKTSRHRISRSAKSTSYECLAILYYNITKNIYLEERLVQERLKNTSSVIGNNLSIDSIQVQPVVNCSLEEKPAGYIWKDTRPRTTQSLPCFSNQGQYASRKCVVNMQNYTSFWEEPDLRNCSMVPTPSTNNSDFENIPLVSADNAAVVANQLLDFTADKNLTREQVDKLVETLKQIVIVSEINSTLASTVLTVLSNILSSSDTALATSSQVALRTVDALTVKMIFTGPSVSITTPNLAVGISAVDSMNYTGTSFSVGSQNGDSEPEVNFEGESRGEALAEIELPPGLFEHLTDDELSMVSRTQFAFFSKTGLFQDPGGFTLQSFVIASSVGNISINNLSEPVKIRIKHRQQEEQFKPQCAFWDLTLNNGSGGWNIRGCHVDAKSNTNETICLCHHLTHFGVLLDISGTAQQIDAVNTKILTFITHIGCGVSAIFSATTLLTYVAFEKLRRDYPSKILMNLSTSLFLLNLTFLIDGWLASFNIPGVCIAVAAFLHFFLLASFTWMGLEAVHMYIALVKVFNTYIRKYMLKFCIIGWGLPALVVVIVLAINKNFYGVELYGKDAVDSGASEFCWINDRIVFYVTCVCYFVILFLMNVAMFIVVLIQICGRNGKKSNRNMTEEILRNLRSVVSLTFLLGMTWGFAFFAWGPVNLIFMYLFAIFNSLQGFFVFVFHCALKENVQKQWRRYLCCGRFRLPENSDWSRTITNNTKKVSSENLGKSLSSSSIGSNSTSWASKFKSGSTFFKSNNKATLGWILQSAVRQHCSLLTSKKAAHKDLCGMDFPFPNGCLNLAPSQGDLQASSSSNVSKQSSLFAAVASSKFDHLDAHQEPVVPVHNILDKATSYYPTHSDNFFKNIMMSENFSHSTKF